MITRTKRYEIYILTHTTRPHNGRKNHATF